MFDNNWFAGLAFGLLGGLVIAAVIFATLSNGLPIWWHHDGTLVTSKDTLANWMTAFFGLVATTIAAFGLIWLRKTWNETKRTADVAQHAFLMSERPYVFVTNVVPIAPLFSDHEFWALNPDLDFFRVAFDLENHGKTPAIVKCLRSSVRIIEDLRGVPQFHSGEIAKWEMIIPAGRVRQATQFLRDKVTAEEAEIISRTRRIHIDGAPKLQVFFYVHIEYESVLGVKDEVMAAFLYDPIANDFLPAESDEFNFRRYGEQKTT